MPVVTPVLLCGGVGSRLWPVSRQGRPKHRLTNPGKFSLELIEVQSGSYLGEDDIVRFEDVYGRSKD